MLIALNRPVVNVTIVPGENFAGMVKHKGVSDDIEMDLWWLSEVRPELEELIMVSMAGQGAECILAARKNRAGYWNGGSSEDAMTISHWMDQLCKNKRFSLYRHYHAVLWSRTVDILQLEWWNIDHLANRLLEVRTMTGDEVTELLESHASTSVNTGLELTHGTGLN